MRSILKRQAGNLDLEYIRASLATLREYIWEFDPLQEFAQLLQTTLEEM